MEHTLVFVHPQPHEIDPPVVEHTHVFVHPQPHECDSWLRALTRSNVQDALHASKRACSRHISSKVSNEELLHGGVHRVEVTCDFEESKHVTLKSKRVEKRVKQSCEFMRAIEAAY